jgi:O-antigen/teichoic acid export membrane protein
LPWGLAGFERFRYAALRGRENLSGVQSRLAFAALLRLCVSRCCGHCVSDSIQPVTHADEPSPVEPTKKAGILRKVAGGAVAEMFGYGMTNLIRLGSNLILTRLLFPEAFGLMAMIAVVLYGIWMLSDVGITQAVVMSPRGDDQDYLDTAWTLQVVRGLILWAAACALTYPVSLWYRQPEVLWILPCASFSAVIHGLASTRVFTLRRRVRVLPLQWMEIVTQLANVGVCVAGASLGYGVAALVAGQLTMAATTTIISHFLPGPTYRNRFRNDPQARHEILHFGRWIFFSSALTFVAIKGDALVFGRLFSSAAMGVYNIALMLAELPDQLASRLVDGVLFPALARVHNERPEAFADEYYRIRLWFDALLFTGLGGLAAMSGWLVDLMYDDRYAGAAGMIHVLAFRSAISMLCSLCEMCFVARGQSVFSFRRNLAVSITLFIAMPLGSHYGGLQGVLWGTVVARATGILVLWPSARKGGFLRFSRELLAVGYLAAGYAVGVGAVYVLEFIERQFAAGF